MGDVRGQLAPAEAAVGQTKVDKAMRNPVFHLVDTKRWACMKVIYSIHYGSQPQLDILEGLRTHLAGTPVVPLIMGEYILLMGERKGITQAQWGTVLGWLMRQPQVVFVQRVLGGWEKQS